MRTKGFEKKVESVQKDLSLEVYLHKQRLCYSMNSLFFSNLSRKFCCDANVVATKSVHFESVHFDQ